MPHARDVRLTALGSLAAMLRVSFALSILAMSLARVFVGGLEQANLGGHGFLSGEWLINYGGGFVRRGLAGELLLLPGLSPRATLYVLLGLQMACYGVLWAYFLWYLVRTRFAWSSIALVCAPSTLLFVGLDPNGGLRKEILLFAVLVCFAVAGRLQSSRPKSAGALMAAGLVLFGLAMFSWEASFVILPAAWYLLHGGAPRLRPAAGIACGVALLVALIGVVAALVAPGDEAVVSAICETLGARGFDTGRLCTGGGAINWIGFTGAEIRAKLAAYFPGHLLYAPMALLAAIPFVTSSWGRRHRTLLIVLVLVHAPLFVLALDYGRWISMMSIEAAICLAASAQEHDDDDAWAAGTAVPYVSLWGFSHCAGTWVPLSLAQFVAKFLARCFAAALAAVRP